jgi:hypothetical protein
LRVGKVITAKDKQIRLSRWGLLWAIFAGLAVLLLFDQFGKSALARPTADSVALIIIAVAMRWESRRHAWFWVTMIFLAALHLPLILLVPWTTRWIPLVVLIPIGLGDVLAMLGVLFIVGKFMEGWKTLKKEDDISRQAL